MVKCLVKSACFINSKRHLKGDTVDFNGKVKNLPDHLEQIKESKSTKDEVDKE